MGASEAVAVLLEHSVKRHTIVVTMGKVSCGLTPLRPSPEMVINCAKFRI